MYRTSAASAPRSEEHTSELQSRQYLLSFPPRRSSDLDPPQQLTVGSAHAGLDRSVNVVSLERFPACITPLGPNVVGIEEHLAREPVVGGRAGAPHVPHERGQRAQIGRAHV